MRRFGGVVAACPVEEFVNHVKFKVQLMAKVSPLQFFRQVKQEVKKVTWPSKKEVNQTLVMVIVIVAIAATFFFVVDQLLGWIVRLVFSLGV